MFEATRSTLAKLLATENITVLQERVSTASFDVKNRVLRLPLWTDTDADTLDHLIGHEVGHALFTPLEGWHDAVCSKGSAFKSYLNVVEDARIEKLIQRKYPGLRSSFIKSYRKLLANGFFGGSIDDINKMGLIDRINTYFKCGMSAGVRFERDERVWLDRIESAETWEQVQQIAEDLFAFAKEKLEEQQQQRQEDYEAEAEAEQEEQEGETFEDDLGESMEPADEADEFDEQFGDQPQAADGADDDADEFEEEDEFESAPVRSEVGGGAGEIASKTDDALRDSIQRELNSEQYDGDIHNWTLPKCSDYQDRIVTFKTILSSAFENGLFQYSLGECFEATKQVGDACYKLWRENNMRHIKLMVKEFEMRKSAGELSRATTAKTGVVDTLKMNNYKFSDDIFKKVSVVPEGKNHGFLMYIDMSGSMSEDIYQTAEQVLLLAHFCQQVGVPFRAYGFSNARIQEKLFTGAVGEPMDSDNVHLIELFSDRMSKSEMATMSKYLLASYLKYATYGRKPKVSISKLRNYDENIGGDLVRHAGLRYFELGGTPLNHAIVNGIPLARDFRKTYRIDILNTFFLTDGASANFYWSTNPSAESSWDRYDSIRSTRKSYYYITNPWTGKRHSFRGGQKTETEMLMEAYKDATGSNMIGYFIIPQTRRELDWAMRQYGSGTDWYSSDDQWKSFRTDGYLTFDAKAYDEFFTLSSKSLQTSDDGFGDIQAGSMSKAQVKRAFAKSKVTGRNTRKMVGDLMKKVA